MDHRGRLFRAGQLYDLDKTGELFLAAVRQNIDFHRRHCPQYAQILDEARFDPSCLRGEADLSRIPVIPTLFLKSHSLFSIDPSRCALTATTSGTRGQKSLVAFDRKSLYFGVRMVLKTFSYHRLLSPEPTNYIVLGYRPDAHTQMGASKTAYGVTYLAPAIGRTFALRREGAQYAADIEGLERALWRYARLGFPVRFVGFPAYMHRLATAVLESGRRFRLNPRSKVLLGGGWKQLACERVDKKTFYDLIYKALGIPEKNCREFFSAVEHPVAYCDCAHHRFHVPIYSRVIIRDVHTLEPVGYGQPGLLSFVTPLVASMPLTSVVTDDLAILREGGCPCGIRSPHFEVLGRAGLTDIRTCAAGAASILEGIGS